MPAPLLAAFGFPATLQLYSTAAADVAATCNLIHALLALRQRDVEQRAQLDDHIQRMRSEVTVSEAARERAQAMADLQERELGLLQNKVPAGLPWTTGLATATVVLLLSKHFGGGPVAACPP